MKDEMLLITFGQEDIERRIREIEESDLMICLRKAVAEEDTETTQEIRQEVNKKLRSSCASLMKTLYEKEEEQK